MSVIEGGWEVFIWKSEIFYNLILFVVLATSYKLMGYYFAKKYKLSAPHSEIVAALPVLQSHQGTESIQALDLRPPEAMPQYSLSKQI